MDFRKSYPVFNRLFWNYAKGLGEAAYNINYNIGGPSDSNDRRGSFRAGYAGENVTE